MANKTPASRTQEIRNSAQSESVSRLEELQDFLKCVQVRDDSLSSF